MEDAVTHPESILPTPPRRHRLRRRACTIVGGALLAYLVVAYLAMPLLWTRYAHRHPALEDLPGVTRTADGTAGDPLNVALIGTKAQVMRAMVEARWYPADPLTLRSCLEIAEATVLKRPYDDAPVSSLYLFGRKEDLAFEQPVGDDPRRRHHVRFWLTERVDADGSPIWIGSAIFDQRVGFSRETGQVTHVTAADIDDERDFLFRDLEDAGVFATVYAIDGFHQVLQGKNGGGDPWFTDGRLFVGVLKAKGIGRTRSGGRRAGAAPQAWLGPPRDGDRARLVLAAGRPPDSASGGRGGAVS